MGSCSDSPPAASVTKALLSKFGTQHVYSQLKVTTRWRQQCRPPTHQPETVTFPVFELYRLQCSFFIANLLLSRALSRNKEETTKTRANNVKHTRSCNVCCRLLLGHGKVLRCAAHASGWVYGRSGQYKSWIQARLHRHNWARRSAPPDLRSLQGSVRRPPPLFFPHAQFDNAQQARKRPRLAVPQCYFLPLAGAEGGG